MTKKEMLMRKVQETCFVAHECVLYLDCHPNNRRALEKHKTAVGEAKKAIAEYESLFGPLTASAAGENGWSWVVGSWPWQDGQD